MQVTCKQKDLALGLQKVSRAVATATTMPVLTGVLIEAKKDGLHLTGTNLMLTIQTCVPAQVYQEGKVVLPGKIAVELVKKINADEITMSSDGPICRIVYGNSKVELNTYDAESYPAAPEVEGIELAVEGQKLREAVSEVIVAAGKESSMTIFSNILIELRQAYLRLVATDSYRMAIKDIPVQYAAQVKDCIVPAKQLYDVVRMLEDGQVMVTLGDNFVKFLTPAETAILRLTEGKFPNYEAVLPKQEKTKVRVKRSLLLDSLERASLFVSEKKIPVVKVSLNGNMKLESYGSEVGGVNEIIEADTEGEALEIAVNTSFFFDAVRVVNADELILSFSEKLKPFKVEPPDGEVLHVILPIRIGGETQ